MEYVVNRLFEMRDPMYLDFNSALIPTVEKERFIGVRVPELRKFANEFYRDSRRDEFFDELPHFYYEENNLHGYMIEKISDFDECISRIESFLPFIDNWATCDTVRPKTFAKNKDKLTSYVDRWLSSERVYTVRYAVGILMSFYLDDGFDILWADRICALDMSEYYVSMMAAWYFATALYKQYDKILPYFERRVLEPMTHDRAIRKAIESRRISDETKEYLRTFRYGRKSIT